MGFMWSRGRGLGLGSTTTPLPFDHKKPSRTPNSQVNHDPSAPRPQETIKDTEQPGQPRPLGPSTTKNHQGHRTARSTTIPWLLDHKKPPRTPNSQVNHDLSAPRPQKTIKDTEQPGQQRPLGSSTTGNHQGHRTARSTTTSWLLDQRKPSRTPNSQVNNVPSARRPQETIKDTKQPGQRRHPGSSTTGNHQGHRTARSTTTPRPLDHKKTTKDTEQPGQQRPLGSSTTE